MKLIYGTTNPSKLSAMRENLHGSPFEIVEPPEPVDADESGANPLENARIKALACYKVYQQPVFALDSGLYIDGLSEAEQPGTHVRRVNGKRLTDEEMLEYYAGLARRMGGYARARYRNAVCLVFDEMNIYEYDGDDIASEPFFLTDKPHEKRNPGFPLDSISVILETLEYYFDVKERYAKIVGQSGYAKFFTRAWEDYRKKKTVSSFVEYTKTPWGEMYYEMVWRQLPLRGERKRILDFGSGTGVNAAHYAQRHDVTAVEPNPQMLQYARPGNYRLINGDISALESIEGDFDAILCHNVLEYIKEREPVLELFAKRLRPGGFLSVVKHNLPGKLMQQAVSSADPQKALALLRGEAAKSEMFGDIGVYEDEWLTAALEQKGLRLEKRYGLRNFWALIQDNSIKSDEQWRNDMLELEMAVQEKSPYRDIAYYHHLIFRKEP